MVVVQQTLWGGVGLPVGPLWPRKAHKRKAFWPITRKVEDEDVYGNHDDFVRSDVDDNYMIC